MPGWYVDAALLGGEARTLDVDRSSAEAPCPYAKTGLFNAIGCLHSLGFWVLIFSPSRPESIHMFGGSLNSLDEAKNKTLKRTRSSVDLRRKSDACQSRQALKQVFGAAPEAGPLSPHHALCCCSCKCIACHTRRGVKWGNVNEIRSNKTNSTPVIEQGWETQG